MKRLRLLLPALAFVVAGAWAIQVIACDKDKATTKANAAVASHSGTCTAEMAAKCTPEMAAACRAKGAKTTAFTASSSNCASHSATAAAHECPYMEGAASTTAFEACTDKASATTAASDHCAGHASATMASSEHCAGKSTATTAAAKTGSSSKVSAVPVGAGGSCGMGAAALGTKSAHNGCDACADLAMCYEELEAAGAHTQIVPLKNGVMFVYTAETPGQINAVQSVMSRRNEHLTQFVTAGDKAHLCPDCQLIRGAMASGKMNREVVNIEGGALTLMTSNDPAIVAKIHNLVSTREGTRSRI